MFSNKIHVKYAYVKYITHTQFYRNTRNAFFFSPQKSHLSFHIQHRTKFNLISNFSLSSLFWDFIFFFCQKKLLLNMLKTHQRIRSFFLCQLTPRILCFKFSNNFGCTQNPFIWSIVLQNWISWVLWDFFFLYTTQFSHLILCFWKSESQWRIFRSFVCDILMFYQW